MPIKSTAKISTNETSETCLKTISNKDENVPDLRRFIKYIGLDDFYPDKLQVRDVMKVDMSVNFISFKEIAFMFVRNIIMMNLNGRDTFVEENLRQKYKLETGKPKIAENSLEHMLQKNNMPANSVLNPLDLTIAVFKCGSPALKYAIAFKCFTCQLAIPFVFPKYCQEDISMSLTPLYSIVIECTSKGNSINEMSLDCPCHVVSFIRMGRLSVSKSTLVNDLLNDQYHNTFFNRDCSLGSSKRCISEGLIEAGWYLPSKKSSVLNCATNFLNLRGDAYTFHGQVNILSNISSVMVILIDLNNLDIKKTLSIIDSLFDNVHGIILAIDASKNTENDFSEKINAFLERVKHHKDVIEVCILSIDGVRRSLSDIKRDMRNFISNSIESKPMLSMSYRLESSKIDTCNDIASYRFVDITVKELWKSFPNSCTDVNEQVIPVQGKPWEEWSKMLKEVNKSSSYKSPSEAGEIKKKMIDQRIKQVVLCQEIQPFMKNFIKYIWQFSEDENKSQVFVMLLKSLLDERSRRILPKFQSQYTNDWQTLKLAKDQKKEESTIKELLSKVKESETNLCKASFGFEHLCRELGQIFEALSECETADPILQEYKKNLPKIAVRLLRIGQPFELMDGNVANVPEVWIKAVFHELKQSLGEKKILALSVLGIQSSGKSTLLNTMFGLQFAVSAGRCTSGVYAQLIPVENDAFKFDYVLIIDTEGLRALELAHLKNSHDNELATFVVGLGDITIVNIKGENTTEVNDVLQIVVHAFLRLKLANKKSKLKQRCLFAHQNVPAQDANKKMRRDRQNLIEILDRMTKEAAAQEHITDIQTFNQVIQLDIETDVWYFSDLWRGDPPMAPVNPGYSETVAGVLEAITKNLIDKERTYLTITDTVNRISDLWKGILQDDFVFGFRNCLEFKAYNNMERYYHSLTWELEKNVRKFIKAEAKSSFMTCDHPPDFDTKILMIFNKLSNIVGIDLKLRTEQLDSFIENNCLKDVMIQWQKMEHTKLKVFGEEIITKARISIFNMKEEIKIEKIKLSEKGKHKIEICQLAEHIADDMKGLFPTKSIIDEKFQEMWNSWISKFDAKAIQHDSSIKEQIDESLHKQYSADVAYWTEFDQSPSLSNIPYNSIAKLERTLTSSNINDEHFSIPSLYHDDDDTNDKKITPDECKVQIVDVVDVIFRRIDCKLSELNVQDVKFDISYVTEILKIIYDEIEDQNGDKNNAYHFNLTTAFRAFVFTHVKRYLAIFFEKLDNKYNEKHSPKAVMEKYRGTVWTLFNDTIESKTEDVILLGLLKATLIGEIDKHIYELLPIDVQSIILDMFPFRKCRLIKNILLELAEKDDFLSVKSYIQDPFVFATNWITDLTNKTMFEYRKEGITRYALLAESRIHQLLPQIIQAISKASKTCKNKQSNTLADWIDNFVESVNENNFPISKEIMMYLKFWKVSDFERFIEMLIKQIKEIDEQLLSSFKDRRPENVSWNENLVPNIMKKLWGCSETCIFCNEPCIRTDKDHVDLLQDHECLQHRPQGIGGFNWVKSSKLCVEFCNHWVGTDQTYILNRGKENEERRKYREYKKHYPHWDIPHSHDKSQYWMWMMCKFKDQLAKMYSKEQPDIPENWPLITKAQALESLSVYILDDNSQDTEKH